MVAPQAGLVASFGLGAIFAVGWTPCIGVILGGILGLAATSETAASGAVLLIGYTLGLGIPFLAVAVLFDRAPALLRPLVRHGRAVSVIGGLLVVAIGLAMIFDMLSLLVRLVPFNTAI
jgi:cytochrome c-type biogenesis protein